MHNPCHARAVRNDEHGPTPARIEAETSGKDTRTAAAAAVALGAERRFLFEDKKCIPGRLP